MSIWSEIRKQQNKKPSVWDSVKPEPRKTAPKPEKYSPPRADNILPPGTIIYDLETGSVDDMWVRNDPDFIRLYCWGVDDGEIRTEPTPIHLLDDFDAHEGWIIGHNIMNYDNILMDKMLGVSILALAKAERLRDTKLLTFLADPPVSRTNKEDNEKYYSLENQGTLYLGAGKLVDVESGKSVLKKLAAEFGGFDKIPQDHPEYNEYGKRDVEVTRDLARVVPINEYAIREHKVAAVCAVISMQGFRVDIPLLKERIKEGEDKKFRILTKLQAYGLPGPETSKSPHQTKDGKTAIDQAFADLGVVLPRTASGQPALGKTVLDPIREGSDNEEVVALAEAVQGLNGIRTIYGNIYDNLVGDRVHPKINLRQSSGRLSITDPGLTVIGKRGGKVIERAVFLPDEGCVLISCDLSQVDARCVAGLSQDPAYLALFEPGRDLHTEMSQLLFKTPNRREEAKAAAHGINYGMQAAKLAWTVGMELHEAEEVVHNFKKSFPLVTRWQEDIRQTGQTVGVLYNGFGRLMRIQPDRAFTQAPALMGQSTARDILMEGVLRLWDMAGERVIRMIRGVIHDELVVSVPVGEVDEIEQVVVEAMSFDWCPVGGSLSVRIMAGLNKRGSNWARCYDK